MNEQCRCIRVDRKMFYADDGTGIPDELYFADCSWKNCEPIPNDDYLASFLDGNTLCITGNGFINIQESEAVFIELTEEQIEQIKKLKPWGHSI